LANGFNFPVNNLLKWGRSGSYEFPTLKEIWENTFTTHTLLGIGLGYLKQTHS